MDKIKFQNLYNKYKNIFQIVIGIFVIYLLYSMYSWVNTEQTDNAVVEADIVNLSPEVHGTITDIKFEDYDYLSKGEVIGHIDKRKYTYKKELALSTLKEAENKLELCDIEINNAELNISILLKTRDYTKSVFDKANKELKRNTELKKDNFSSQKILDEVNTSYHKASFENNKNQLEIEQAKQKFEMAKKNKIIAELEVDKARNQLLIAEHDLEKTDIRAPISGVIASSDVREGNFVRPGIPIAKMIPKKLYIKANFKETQIVKFKKGKEVKIYFDVYPSKKVIGKIRRLSPATGSKYSIIPPDNATGNFVKVVQRVPVIIDFNISSDLENKIVPGMSCKVYVGPN